MRREPRPGCTTAQPTVARIIAHCSPAGCTAAQTQDDAKSWLAIQTASAQNYSARKRASAESPLGRINAGLAEPRRRSKYRPELGSRLAPRNCDRPAGHRWARDGGGPRQPSVRQFGVAGCNATVPRVARITAIMMRRVLASVMRAARIWFVRPGQRSGPGGNVGL
jgi:hypothetical protein